MVFFEFQILALKKPCSFCFCHLRDLGLYASPFILIAKPLEERVREREREKRGKKREREILEIERCQKEILENETLRGEVPAFQSFS